MEKPERLKGGIFIHAKDIQLLNNCSLKQAKAEHLTIRDILQAKPRKLTVKAYCEYLGLDYQTVVEYLNPYR
jgi:hypothetical protein